MKLKDWIISLFSLAIIVGVYFGITFAVILAWIVTLLAIVGMGIGCYYWSKVDSETQTKARNKLNPFKLLWALVTQVLFVYVFWVTGSLSLLFAYGILLVLTYTFIYQIFKQEEN